MFFYLWATLPEINNLYLILNTYFDTNCRVVYICTNYKQVIG